MTHLIRKTFYEMRSINFVDDMWIVSKWNFCVRTFEIPNDLAVNYSSASEDNFKAQDPTLTSYSQGNFDKKGSIHLTLVIHAFS